MGCLLNILWHFPFLGFIFALLYAIFGVIMCCTIILLPIGMAWFQIAKFMLAPFSSAMVSRSDYEMITGKKQNEAYATFSLVIRILYFPFGCIAAFFSVFNIAFGFLSIVGIPIALVHTKLFKTYFNPIGKVCVPKAVGDEIERIKSAEIVGKYTGRNMQANVSCASACTAPEPEECVREDNRPQVRRFDDARLEEIVNNPDMYNAELVAQCRREIEIRIKSESLSEKVAGFDDGKLREIMSSVGVYADELIYSCEKEYDRRAQLRREEMERAQEQARIEREKEAEAERIRYEERNKIIKEKAIFAAKILGIVITVIAAICLVVYLCSDMHRYKSAIRLQEKGNLDKAIAKLSRIKDGSEFYERAQYNLYLDYLGLQDSLAAGTALVNAVRNGNWDVYEAYQCYVNHFLNDDFPSDARSAKPAIELLELSPNPDYWIIAGEIYFSTGQYDMAYRIFSKHCSWSNKANGYIGIMYLYGLAGLESDADTAYKYLLHAPNENPFLVHKGDLMLFLRKSNNRSIYGSTVYDSIEAADRFYEMATREDTCNKAYADRYKITQQMIKTKQKHDKIAYWDRGKVFWDSYYFDNNKSSYRGETMWYGGNYTRGAHGWGYFDFKDKELNIGKFSYCKNDGLCLKIIPRKSGQSYSIFVGEYKNNVPVKGSYIFDDGDIWTGKFKPTSKYFELSNGSELDLHGNKIRDIKN